MGDEKKPRRPKAERDEIKQIREELGVKHTTALRILEQRKRDWDARMNQVKNA